MSADAKRLGRTFSRRMAGKSLRFTTYFGLEIFARCLGTGDFSRMAHPSSELQKTIFETLTGDRSLTSLLGGPKVFDRRPERIAFPYLTLGRTAVVDWSTGTEDGSEHILTLHVWAKGGGKQETYEIMDKVSVRLNGANLPLEGHHLVNLQLQFAEARQETDSATYHGILRFRAVTEPVA